jgi:tetratricopeptide (TPR) repeat protein
VKTILATFLTFILLLPVSAIGEIQTITHTVKQPFAGSQSPDDARISAVAKAKREALEMAGTYIESLTVVKNSHVDKDEILALAAGVLKAEVVSQKNYHTEDAFGIDVIVKVVVDTSILEERVKKLLLDKTHLTQLKDAQKREKGLLQKVAQLEGENRRLTAIKQNTRGLKNEFQQASRGLTAVDWVNQALALRDRGKLTDPKKAIEYLNNAIKLQPDYADAYLSRGIAYDNLRQHQRAVEDFNEAIRLKPDLAYAYNNRGNVYRQIGQHQRAIEDFNEAIRLKPDNSSAYNNRGLIYANLGQYQRAIEDYNKAISLKPDYTGVYSNRGNVYRQIGQYQRAIEDFNEAIRLEPDEPGTYNNRAIAYLSQGKNNLGCRDAQKACELGLCKVLEHAKRKGYCH